MFALLTVLAPLACGQTAGQTTSQTKPPQAAATAIITTVDEVNLDMVVHDKRNKPVLDLKPDDVAVTDSGSAVRLSGLRLVTGATSAQHLVTLVFDRLDPSGAKNAHDIAAKILKMIPENGFSFSVLAVGGRLRLFQAFTSDRVAVGKAVALATERAELTKEDSAARPEKNLVAVAQTGTDSSGTQVGVEERNVARMTLASLEESQRIVQDQHAPPSLASLLALTRTEHQLPGRKVVIYFAQGMMTDSSSRDMLRSIVDSANRSGVSIYTIDANGISSAGREGLISTVAIAGAAQGAPAAPIGQAAQVPQAFGPGMYSQISQQYDRFENAGMAGSSDPMAELALNTGGRYVMPSDGLKKPLQQLVEDVTTYYEASFAPPIQEFDGKFRPVAVRPVRKGLRIRSTAGYFALPSSVTSGVKPFEAPLMKILGETQLPDQLKFKAGIIRFGDLPDGNSNTLVVEVPLSQVEMREDPNANLFLAHVSVVAQIKNKTGTVIEHFSEDIPRHGSLESMDEARTDVVTLQRHFIAAPGEYHLETAVLDRNSGRASAQRTDFDIANTQAGPSLSDLAVIRRTEPIAADADLLEPLHYEKARLVPNLSGRVSPEVKSLSLFFMVHPDAQAPEPATLELEVLRNGESAGRVPLQLRKNNGPGAIPYLASIGGGSLAAGNYEVLATFTQGGNTSERSTSFTVEGPQLASAGSMTRADAAKPGSNDAAPVADSSPETASLESRQAHRLIITALPESAVQPPTADEVEALIADARTRALRYSASLPNFICVEVTDRSVDAAANGKWRRRDTIAELLRYRDNAETRTTLEINGKRSGTAREELKGALSLGEFGGVLNAVFQPSSKTDFQWKETDALGGGTVQVLRYHVAQANSSWGLAGDNNWKLYPEFHGLVYIDTATKGVRRITLEANELPRDFLIRSASIVVDYDYIAIGTHDYLMPVRGTVGMREGKREAVLNEMEFRNYRRYASKSTIRYGGQQIH